MNRFEKGHLNLPPVKAFITSTMKATGCSRKEAKREYNKLKTDVIYVNDLYQVNIDKSPPHNFGDEVIVWHISIKRRDKKAIHDWRHLQVIKNELVGEEIEAIEIYPKESRLVDTANQYHLWAFLNGWTIPVGFFGRSVTSESDEEYGTVQRPIDEDLNYG